MKTNIWRLHIEVLAQFVRHTRRNPQKLPAELVPDPKRTVKSNKASQKGASGSSNYKKSHASLKDKVIPEDI